MQAITSINAITLCTIMMKLVTLLCLFGLALGAKVRYDGFEVYRILPQNEEQIHILRELEENNLAYKFWTSPGAVNRPVDVMVAPHLVNEFKEFLNRNDFNSKILMNNVQDRIDNERPKQRQSRAYGWDDYHTLEEIYEWLYEQQALYPNIVTVVNAGTSFENREILGVHISFSPDNINNAVFIESGIHAREWIAPAVATYLINEILSSNDTAFRSSAERYDWYIFPVFNPDGYVYSFTDDRMWRKTRTPYSPCIGADPNRNWAYRWNTGGASNNTCSEIYHGPYPFSEREVATTSVYISSISSRFIAYLALHSFGQMYLIPFAHTAAPLENFQELYEVGLKGAEVLYAHHGTEYIVGNVVSTLYVATGNSVDWVKGNFRTRITYTVEFRDRGAYAFILPARYIIPSGEESVDSFITILNEFNLLS